MLFHPGNKQNKSKLLIAFGYLLVINIVVAFGYHLIVNCDCFWLSVVADFGYKLQLLLVINCSKF